MTGLPSRMFAYLFAGVMLLASTEAVALDVPARRAHVTDDADMLTKVQRVALEAKLTAHEAATGQQFAVLIIPSLEGAELEAFSLRVARTWALGRAMYDDGLLMLIVRAEHKLRIEVGLGLERAISNEQAGRILQEQITPAFRAGRYADGIGAGFDKLIALAKAAQSPAPSSKLAR